ncbi:TPA: hypothetical protein ACQ2HX_000190 [Klebsiella pneumoniae]
MNLENEKHLQTIEHKLGSVDYKLNLLIKILLAKNIITYNDASFIWELLTDIPENIPDPSYRNIVIAMRDKVVPELMVQERQKLKDNLKRAITELHAFEVDGGFPVTDIRINE